MSSAALAADAPAPGQVRQILALTAEAIARQPAARVEGVVTFHEPATGITFIQDETGGIALAAGTPSQLPAEVGAGTRLAVEGVVAAGSFAPVLAGPGGKPPLVRILGRDRLPAPLQLGLEQLLGGTHDGRWVEMIGTVRELTAKPYVPEIDGLRESDAVGTPPAPTLRLSIVLGTVSGRYTLIVPWTSGRPPPTELLDARIRVRGVLGSIVNRWRQWVGLLLYVPTLDEIWIDRPPAGDPFALPLQRVDELMGYAAESRWEDRVRVRGVVTLVQPGFRVFLRSAEGPLEARVAHSLAGVAPGSEVEVVGYPTLFAKRVLLEECRLRPVARRPPPAPVPLSRSETLNRYADGELVSITARLFQNTLRGATRVLVLEDAGQLFEARFVSVLAPAADERIGQLRPGAELAVTGIAQVLGAADWGGGVKPYAVSVLLREPDDVVLQREPPWWTPGRLLAILTALAVLVVIAAGWVVLLRRRVAAQTRVIREQAFREAHERERRRIAQDIHDDLGSRLTQLALLGARVKSAAGADPATSELGDRISTTARTTVQTMDEIVWAMNPGNDTLQSLGDYLCKIATSLLSGADIACQLDVPAVLPVRSVGADQRHNLVLAVREALHNVVKHSGARKAGLTLNFASPTLTLEVWDNGMGLPATGAGRGNGLGNLRRRLADVHGTCDVVSAPGEGTRVRLSVSLDGAA